MPSLPCLSIWTRTAQAGPLLLASQISPTWYSWQCSQSFTASSLSILGYRSLVYLFDKSSSLTALHTAMLVSLGVSSLVPCSNHLWLYLTHFTYQTMSHPSFQSSESDIISTFPWIFQNLLSLKLREFCISLGFSKQSHFLLRLPTLSIHQAHTWPSERSNF